MNFSSINEKFPLHRPTIGFGLLLIGSPRPNRRIMIKMSIKTSDVKMPFFLKKFVFSFLTNREEWHLILNFRKSVFIGKQTYFGLLRLPHGA